MKKVMLNVVKFLAGFNSHLELNFIFYMFAKTNK